MHPAIVSGIVIGDAPVSYWPIFFPLFEEQSHKSLLKVSSPQFVSLSNVANFLLYIVWSAPAVQFTCLPKSSKIHTLFSLMPSKIENETNLVMIFSTSQFSSSKSGIRF